MTPSNDPRDIEGEYTRFRANIQLGDGPDRRGDVTIEIVREREEVASQTPREVELPSGERIQTETMDAAFAEFYIELDRASTTLRETLGLPPG